MGEEIHKKIKEDSITFYDELKEKYLDCNGCSMLIDKLLIADKKTFEEIPGDHLQGLGHSLALTPIDEIPKLKTTFDDILAFKEERIKNNFDEISIIAKHDTAHFIEKMKETEISLVKNLQDRRDRFRI